LASDAALLLQGPDTLPAIAVAKSFGITVASMLRSPRCDHSATP
jgi:hypothetical protein